MTSMKKGVLDLKIKAMKMMKKKKRKKKNKDAARNKQIDLIFLLRSLC